MAAAAMGSEAAEVGSAVVLKAVVRAVVVLAAAAAVAADHLVAAAATSCSHSRCSGSRSRQLADGCVSVRPRRVAVRSPRGEALWRRGRAVRDVVRPDTAGPIPVEVTGRGRAGRFVVEEPTSDSTAAAAVWVPVEPEGRAVRFVVRCPGGGGALHSVGECCRAA
eukprot:scaffold22937_cov60-Phaeocystis_antarctica.AAC.3